MPSRTLDVSNSWITQINGELIDMNFNAVLQRWVNDDGSFQLTQNTANMIFSGDIPVNTEIFSERELTDDIPETSALIPEVALDTISTIDDNLKHLRNIGLPKFDESILENKSLYVKYFGFEIEGGFDSDVAGDYDSYCEDCDCDRCDCGCEAENDNPYFKEDGSVRSDDICGEIASPKFRIDRLEQFETFAKNNMPIDANSSSGIHVHLSFNNDLAYSKCMDREFFDSFRQSVYQELNDSSKYSELTRNMFNDRYNNVYSGHTNYCSSDFYPDTQIDETQWRKDFPDLGDHGRYTQMNYYSYHSHHTIECRIFPTTTDSNELISMVKFFINFTQSYLNNQGTYERGNYIKTEILEQNEIDNEVITLCV